MKALKITVWVYDDGDFYARVDDGSIQEKESDHHYDGNGFGAPSPGWRKPPSASEEAAMEAALSVLRRVNKGSLRRLSKSLLGRLRFREYDETGL